jgi:hypothetical protein
VGPWTLVAVDTNGEAERLRFPGSPTIRVEGEDIFPSEGTEWEDWRLGCRLYATREGIRGDPTAEMIRDAIVRWGPFTEGRGSGFLGPDPWCVGELLGRL